MENILIPTNNNGDWKSDGRDKVVVLMSGGVDSAAAALKLKLDGYNVLGLTMLISKDRTLSDSARYICEYLNIPHFSVDIQEEFKKRVSSPFREAYILGETPNPCADCNEQIKFGHLWDLAEAMWGPNFYISTGHYARILSKDNNSYLAQAMCTERDQSYFLAGIKKERINRIIFPLGNVRTKEETRNFVRAERLPVAEKPESMEICFANEKNYRYLLASSTGGNIINLSGDIVGKHNGIENFTLGQRKGLGITGGKPLYVVKIEHSNNSVTVAERDFAFFKTVRAKNLNILVQEFLTDASCKLMAKTRSQAPLNRCKIITANNKQLKIEFEKPTFAPAQGQRLVLYTDDGIVVAGGVILPREE